MQERERLPTPPATTIGRARTMAAPRVVQAKLAVGRVDDPLEREADRIAELVVRELAHGQTSSPISSALSATRIDRADVPPPGDADVHRQLGAGGAASPTRIRRGTTAPATSARRRLARCVWCSERVATNGGSIGTRRSSGH